jgi:hypothetical protein
LAFESDENAKKKAVRDVRAKLSHCRNKDATIIRAPD